MDSIYVLLLTAVLYIFFGTIVDVFTTKDNSTQLTRIKIKVFFQTFVSPIIFGLVLLYVKLTDNRGFDIFFGMGLILGTFIKVFLGQRKYLSNFSLNTSQLEISYLISFLNAKKYSIHLADITNLEIEKGNWLFDYSAVIKIRDKDKWTKFYLIDKTIKSAIESDIEAINKTIAANGAEQYLPHQQQNTISFNKTDNS